MLDVQVEVCCAGVNAGCETVVRLVELSRENDGVNDKVDELAAVVTEITELHVVDPGCVEEMLVVKLGGPYTSVDVDVA